MVSSMEGTGEQIQIPITIDKFILGYMICKTVIHK